MKYEKALIRVIKVDGGWKWEVSAQLDRADKMVSGDLLIESNRKYSLPKSAEDSAIRYLRKWKIYFYEVVE